MPSSRSVPRRTFAACFPIPRQRKRLRVTFGNGYPPLKKGGQGGFFSRIFQTNPPQSPFFKEGRLQPGVLWLVAVAGLAAVFGASFIRAESLPPVPDFMIDGPIGEYAPRTTPGVIVSDILEAVLGRADHVKGNNYLYSVTYVNEASELRIIDVNVEEVEDPRWILHEMELYLRAPANLIAGLKPDDRQKRAPYFYEVRTVAGQRVLFMANGQYIWPSGPNRVVQIHWGRQEDQPDGTFVNRELPEEFLTAYLARLPSSLPALVFDAAHEQGFIREEFDRDLERVAWHLRKWEANGAQKGDQYMWVKGGLDAVRRRRHRYFSGISLKDRELQILAQMKKASDPEFFYTYQYQKAQYEELKKWWDQHRNDAIDLTR